ncbi:MAG: ammonium transporter [Alphaproteobacteria bacterium]
MVLRKRLTPFFTAVLLGGALLFHPASATENMSEPKSGVQQIAQAESSVPQATPPASPAPESAPAAAAKIDSGDTAWMLVSTALVLLMTIPGLALFYAGMVRKKNILTVLSQSFATTAVIAVLWAVIGYSLSFGNGFSGGTAYLGDFSRAFLGGMDVNEPFTLGKGTAAAVPFTIPESVFMMFQMTFAIITPALIAGSIADRMKFSAYLWFITLWSLLVYAPVAHWVWHPNGFLFADGVLDFAGGTVVHINAGISGLVAALVLGKRLGYPAEQAPPYNLLYAMVGASLLWVGWFGFNAGSAGAANGRAGMAMTVTMLAAAAATVTWMLAEWSVSGKPSLLGMVSGAVAGLVAITPASGYVDSVGGLAIGGLAGVVCYWSVSVLKPKLGYDDTLDCFGVHGIAGFLGAILTGVFATSAVTGATSPVGLIDGNAKQLLLQFEGAAITIIYAGVVSFILLKLIDAVIGLRVSQEVERDGLDHSLHGQSIS